METAAVSLVFAASIVGLYVHPARLRGWQVVAAGAALAWAIGDLSWSGGLGVLGESLGIDAFFLGLMLLAAAAQRAGLYRDLQEWLGRLRQGRPAVLGILALGTGITALLSNDMTPLVLTPAAVALARGRAAGMPPGVFAITFIADGASLLLPVSNPVNLLYYERFDMTLASYLSDISVPAVAGVGALIALTTVAPARRPLSLRAGGTLPETPPAVDRPTATAVRLAIPAIAVCYLAAAIARLPLALVTLGAGALLATVLIGRDRRALGAYGPHVSPGVLLLVPGLMLLVAAARASGSLDWLAAVLSWLADRPEPLTLTGAVILATVLANALNNWPAALVLSAGIRLVDEGAAPLVTGSLIGCTIGANLTPFGSLSTVFWTSLLAREGEVVTHREYIARALLPTMGALVAATAVAVLLA